MLIAGGSGDFNGTGLSSVEACVDSRLGGYLQTNVVTVVAASEADKTPPVTVIAVPAARLAADEVTFGVQEPGAV